MKPLVCRSVFEKILSRDFSDEAPDAFEGTINFIARREIFSPERTFAKGKHLVGRQAASGTWTVWARRNPLETIEGVSSELLRQRLPRWYREEQDALNSWCAPGQSIEEMLELAAERD